MSTLKDLVLSVYTGQRSIESLSNDEADQVIMGLQQVAEFLSNDENTAELANEMQKILDGKDDIFFESIEEAEARGATYWEVENDYIH